jgi:hypothetical protein
MLNKKPNIGYNCAYELVWLHPFQLPILVHLCMLSSKSFIFHENFILAKGSHYNYCIHSLKTQFGTKKLKKLILHLIGFSKGVGAS